MKKIRVYIQYPWKTSDSPYYKALVENPPKNVEYLKSEHKLNLIISPKFGLFTAVKKLVRHLFAIRRMPNIRTQEKVNCDLYHSAHCLLEGDKPWIVDIENYWNFAPSYFIAHSKKGKSLISSYLKSKNCKKIVAWTEEAKKTVVGALKDNEIENKIEVVYPAIPLPKFNKIKKDKITLLFLGRYFYSKGGWHTLKIFDAITKKFDNVECIFISQTPKKFIKKYSNNKKIKFYELMDKKKIFEEIYPQADIFVYPGFSDTFGFAMIEAMGFGLPVLSVNRFAREEIITNEKTGFIIKIPQITYGTAFPNIQDGVPIVPNEEAMIDEFIKRISDLIEDKKKLEKMSKNCISEVKSGKFSLERMNKSYEKIYSQALNKNEKN